MDTSLITEPDFTTYEILVTLANGTMRYLRPNLEEALQVATAMQATAIRVRVNHVTVSQEYSWTP